MNKLLTKGENMSKKAKNKKPSVKKTLSIDIELKLKEVLSLFTKKPDDKKYNGVIRKAGKLIIKKVLKDPNAKIANPEIPKAHKIRKEIPAAAEA
ncbi:MAG TPA: hypothetical protein VGG71_06130 [Chitinophagaceae bacterium]